MWVKIIYCPLKLIIMVHLSLLNKNIQYLNKVNAFKIYWKIKSSHNNQHNKPKLNKINLIDKLKKSYLKMRFYLNNLIMGSNKYLLKELKVKLILSDNQLLHLRNIIQSLILNI